MLRFPIQYYAMNAICLLFLVGIDSLLGEELFKQPKMVEAETRFNEAIDKAKRLYQIELERELASAKRRGDLQVYGEIEKELEHTKGKTGHVLTSYAPKATSTQTSKRNLDRNVEAAKTRYTTALKAYSRDLLRSGDVDQARLLDQIAGTGDPAKGRAIVETLQNMEDTEFKVQRADMPHKEVLIGAWTPVTPQAKMIRELKPPQASKSAYGAAWSADGLSIATYGYANFARLWDLKTGRIVAEIPKRGDSRGTGVVFLNKKNLVVFGGSEGEVCLWNPRQKSMVWHKKENGWTGAVAVSPDESLVAAATDNIVYIRNAENGEVITKLDHHTKKVSDAAFFLQGLRFVTASEDGSAVVWDTMTWKPLRSLQGHSEEVSCVSVSPDDRWIATGSSDDMVVIWNARTGEAVERIGGFHGNVISVVFSPDGKKMAVGKNSNGEFTLIVDTNSWTVAAYCMGHGWWNSRPAWSPDSRRIVTCGEEAMIFELPNE